MTATSPSSQLMLTIKVLLIVILLGFANASSAQDPGARLTAAQERYRAGDLDGALGRLEQLLTADDLDHPMKRRIRELAARILQSRGEEYFRRARIAQSIEDEGHSRCVADSAGITSR